MSKVFALIDCNSFYCSCEQVFQPHLRGQPIVVLSNNDGCAISRTKEAKALGVKMGTPEFMIRENPQMKSTIMFSSNYTLYGDMSRRVQDVVREFVPHVEVYSIDELFLDLAGLETYGLERFGRELRATVLQYVGIPTGVGIGPTKTLAKIANFIAKTYPEFNGVFSMMDPNICTAVLDKLPIEEIWGIGRASVEKLNALGIEYAGQLRDMEPKRARQYGTVVAERLIFELRGVSCLALEEVAPPLKGTAVTRSFGRPVTNFDEIAEAISSYAARGGEKLRRHDLVASRLTVFLQTNKHRKTVQYARSAQCTLTPMTNDSRALIEHAMILARRVFKKGIEYGKGGIMLDDLRPQSSVQPNMLFADKPKSAALMKVVDALNRDHGRNTIQFAGMGLDKPWRLRCLRKSPCYTTRLADVAKVRAN